MSGVIGFLAGMGQDSALRDARGDELTAATTGIRKRADFEDLVGKWTPDPEFDAILSSQRQIDPKKWK